ncbi:MULTISPECIES: hypothetical protein [Chryseobacterium]|uniref:TonB C-terminal domain-containing protein n=1 Tax=Chryseobacterium camelliae TaxID=1265445 RepID=A0ABU0TLZ5_9FLAO|nr:MULTISPECIES: hypothetical protein [Chryseobacterium]MDQ1098068.1 hypothetical protein [Chryseobacterium camelliae]MDR6085435.1 hypothetical protein [Chryseobacterium sp. SORGH_AS_0909]MDR6129799.1 hypothetical protein [Chryseobacterium sp. SORGH_AS_1175]MDT3408077.1 hypothetical protein [Pseudacidovorax intermedius]
MKTLILFLGLLMANFCLAQYDVEDRDDTFITESSNNKNILKIDIREPFFQVAAKNCGDFKAADIEGGVTAYREMLRKNMYVYLNTDFYVLNGDFTFTLTIDENGEVADIEGSPKVANSQIFFDDMKYIMRRLKKSWIPATCNGKPIASKIKIKMNLSSISTDL